MFVLQCPHCDRVFHKHTQLRSHVVGEHSDLLATNQPPSRRSGSGKNTPTALAPSNITITIDQLSSALSQTVANAAMPGPHESSDIRFRPFQCDVPGCEWSFETAQRLKMHKKTHKSELGRSAWYNTGDPTEMALPQRIGTCVMMKHTARISLDSPNGRSFRLMLKPSIRLPVRIRCVT